MVLYAAKLKENAKKVSAKTDLPPTEPVVDKKEQARLKRQEKARLKKEARELEDLELQKQQAEAEKLQAEKQAELEKAERELEEKKLAKKEKRRLARKQKMIEKSVSPPESVQASETTAETQQTLVDDVKQEKVKKPRKRKQQTLDAIIDEEVEKIGKKQKKTDEPPAWFKKYVAGVKNEESQHQSARKPKKEIAKEADQMAAQQWGNGLVRDRVRNEVDQHMSRMYQMIFNRGL